MQVPGAIQVLNVKEPTSENKPQDRTFRNMKSKIVTHVQSQTHKEKEIEKKLNNDKKKGSEQKNKEEAAMRCARLSHELIKMGRPFTDYPELVKNGVYMGDKNHSEHFPANFLKSVASVVRGKIKETLEKNSSRLAM